jgi:hypothetical protein
MNHKDLVRQIADLDWTRAAPSDIILLSRCTAREFATSLRLGVTLYPDDKRLMEMVSGELETNNMVFDDYTIKGDHWEFLEHFIKRYEIIPTSAKIQDGMDEYVRGVEAFSDTDRAMTVFSREEELTLIFKKIVVAHDWEGLGFRFYEFYLKQHILFDSGDHGHAWLTRHFPMHEPTLIDFYKIRLRLYQALF